MDAAQEAPQPQAGFTVFQLRRMAALAAKYSEAEVLDRLRRAFEDRDQLRRDARDHGIRVGRQHQRQIQQEGAILDEQNLTLGLLVDQAGNQEFGFIGFRIIEFSI